MSEATTMAKSEIEWFELPVENTERAQKFYGELFGWKFEPFGSDDYLSSDEAGGALSAEPGEQGLLAYFGVADLGTSVAAVTKLGGEAGDPQDIPGVGRFARCTDLDGNRFGLYEGIAEQ